MHNARASASPPATPLARDTQGARRPGARAQAAGPRGPGLLAAWARSLQRVLPLRQAAGRAHAGASDDSEETAMHSPCL